VQGILSQLAAKRKLRQAAKCPGRGLLGALLRDQSGNTLMLIAAAIAPLLAMVGGGIDMGRSYLSEVRLGGRVGWDGPCNGRECGQSILQR
jgi:hypothetical protein